MLVCPQKIVLSGQNHHGSPNDIQPSTGCSRLACTCSLGRGLLRSFPNSPLLAAILSPKLKGTTASRPRRSCRKHRSWSESRNLSEPLANSNPNPRRDEPMARNFKEPMHFRLTEGASLPIDESWCNRAVEVDGEDWKYSHFDLAEERALSTLFHSANEAHRLPPRGIGNVQGCRAFPSAPCWQGCIASAGLGYVFGNITEILCSARIPGELWPDPERKCLAQTTISLAK
ncbi:hypothetical protein BN1723_014060 [Verticillium longisporum]|uniref:Uncharacterized protein n=1 Tax=Verticillium longisporum TaxID=100787 RepID=A0A0G4M133_VERLO|nr:hypothetical protein BN1723_014060 [Verticillium longisporum]